MTSARLILALSFVLSLSGVVSAAQGDETLPRRGFLGARLEPVPEDVRVLAKLDENAGVLIRSVFPDTAASEADLRPRDIILRIDDIDLRGKGVIPLAVGIIGAHMPGDEMRLALLREGKRRHATVNLKPIPMESHPEFETIYTAVDVDGALHRVIITKPRDASNAPAVFYVQGLGCSSIDAPHNVDDPIRQLLNGLTRAGFVTLRIEKRGEGDSQGAPCEEMDFATELRGYEAGLEFLSEQSFVDSDRLFLFGHSMGGVFAPVLAKNNSLRGIIVYGTIASSMPDYFEENNRRQLFLRGVGATNVEKSLDQVKEFARLFFKSRLTPGEILARRPEFKGFFAVRNSDDTHFHGRHYTFWQQLNFLDLPRPWREVESPVLAIWGMSDIPADRADHALLVDTVNDIHPGNATFLKLPNIDHGFATAVSRKESSQNRQRGTFNPIVVTETLAWLRRQ